jgi:hypothetical protein
MKVLVAEESDKNDDHERREKDLTPGDDEGRTSPGSIAPPGSSQCCPSTCRARSTRRSASINAIETEAICSNSSSPTSSRSRFTYSGIDSASVRNAHVRRSIKRMLNERRSPQEEGSFQAVFCRSPPRASQPAPAPRGVQGAFLAPERARGLRSCAPSGARVRTDSGLRELRVGAGRWLSQDPDLPSAKRMET